jgi:hypothetical protein
MKAKVGRGDGFRGVLNYTHDEGPKATGQKKPERIAGNMAGQTVQELVREFGITKKLRPDCKNPVWHCSLALPEGDRLSADRWGELARDFMIEMGMDPSNFLYDVQRHNDTDFDHIHIAASRIGLDGTLWHGGNDVFAAIEATQKLEQKHGLTLTPGYDPEHKKERKSVTHREMNMAVRTGLKPPRMVCQESIDAVLQSKGVISAPQFINELAAVGVRAVPNIATTGTLNGFSFEVEGVSFTGSKLGESFKWAQLQKRGVQYEQIRDFEELANAKRAAAERAGTGSDADTDQRQVGSDGTSGAELGATAPAGRRPGDGGTDPAFDTAPGRTDSAGSIRHDHKSTERHDSSGGRVDSRQSGEGNESKNRESGPAIERHLQDTDGSEQSSRRLEIQSVGSGGDTQKDNGRSDEFDQRIEHNGAQLAGESRQSGQEHIADSVRDGGSQQPSNSSASAGWSTRFKVTSAQKTAKTTPKSKVPSQQRDYARIVDPTAYLENCGFIVKREGRHLSVRDSSGDERYRVTRKEDGHYVTCDQYENGIGDNIALVMEIDPGTGFADAVYMLAGAPSVSSAIRPTPAPAPVRRPPRMPEQTDDDVRRGREYLVERGISPETIQFAEKSGMLRYSSGGVLFVGRDEFGVPQNITCRSIDPSAAVQKKDVFGTEKRHPQVLAGNPNTVWIVEGGVDALAVHDIARRSNNAVPTVIVSGGANVRSWIDMPWVQKILKLAKKIVVAFERESSTEKQLKTDAAHQLQIEKLRELCGGQVQGWMPPEGSKDIAELNQVQQQTEIQERKSTRPVSAVRP